MQAVLLGTGSPPPSPKRRGPSALLSLGAGRFLVDAGSGVGVQLECCEMARTSWEAAARRHYAGPLVIGTDLRSVQSVRPPSPPKGERAG